MRPPGIEPGPSGWEPEIIDLFYKNRNIFYHYTKSAFHREIVFFNIKYSRNGTDTSK